MSDPRYVLVRVDDERVTMLRVEHMRPRFAETPLSVKVEDVPVPLDDPMVRAIDAALKDYRCQHTVDADGDGLPLADVLTPPTEGTIAHGVAERDLLVEHIVEAIYDRFGLDEEGP